MAKKQYYQITDEDVKKIILDLMKKCETHPKDIAEYIEHNGDVIGQLYNIKYYLEQINQYEKEKTNVDGFVKFYEKQYHRKPTKQDIQHHIKLYQKQVDYYKNELQHYLLSDSVFYNVKCKVLNFNDGNFDKIFTPKQVELIYKAIEKYVVENKKIDVIFAKRDYEDSCISGLNQKHIPLIVDLIFKHCNLQKILKIYHEEKDQIANDEFLTQLKNKLIKEGTIKDLYQYLLISTYKSDDKQTQNNQEIANKMLECINQRKDKKTLRRILFGLNNKDRSDKHAREIIKYFNKKELLKTYIDLCSKKEIDEFVSEIARNKYEAEHPPVYDNIELC